MKTPWLSVILISASCTGPAGPQGPPGPAGSAGVSGANGEAGANGASGQNGANGEAGAAEDAAVADAQTSGATAGTRLRPIYTKTVTTTSDGAQSTSTYQSGWFDTQRNEPCTFIGASDGTTRCLPTPVAIYDYSNGSYFSDSNCTSPLAVTGHSNPACGATTPPAPKYMMVAATVNGCSGTSIHPIGTKTSPSSVYVKSGGGCYASAPSPSYDYFTPYGSEIAPTGFVQVTTTTTEL